MTLDFRFDERVPLFQEYLIERGKDIWDKVEIHLEENEISIYLHLKNYTQEITRRTYELLRECIGEREEFGKELGTTDWWHAGLYFGSELKDNIFPFEVHENIWEGNNLSIPYYMEEEIFRILSPFIFQKSDVVLELQDDDMIIVDVRKWNHSAREKLDNCIETKLNAYIESKNFIPMINWADG